MYNIVKYGKGRFFLTSTVRNYFPSVAYAPSRRLLHRVPRPVGEFRDSNGRPFPRLVVVDPFARPLPSEWILSLIKSMKRLSKEEKHEFRFMFSEVLGLPTPPKTPKGPDERFVVKLIKFEKSKYNRVLREVAWAKSTKEKASMSKFYLGGSYKVVDNVPSIVKQYITKEEAEDLAAKLNAAGGVAVIMEVDEEEAVIKEVDEEEG